MNISASDFLKQFYSYRRPFQEVEGYHIKRDEDDGTDVIFINALGVDPADVAVQVRTEYPKSQLLTVSGKTKNKILDEDFSVNLAFYVRKPIKVIRKSFSSGLLILKLEYDTPEQPKVEIVEE